MRVFEILLFAMMVVGAVAVLFGETELGDPAYHQALPTAMAGLTWWGVRRERLRR